VLRLITITVAPPSNLMHSNTSHPDHPVPVVGVQW
jgi:hypothetical protein